MVLRDHYEKLRQEDHVKQVVLFHLVYQTLFTSLDG